MARYLRFLKRILYVWNVIFTWIDYKQLYGWFLLKAYIHDLEYANRLKSQEGED